MKLVKFMAIASLTMAITSCQKEDVEIQETPGTNAQQQIPTSDLAKLEGMGYDTKDIVVSAIGEGYLVEGDILITPDFLASVEESDSARGQKQRWWSDHPLQCTVVDDVKIFQDGLPDYLADALGDAIQRWNNNLPGVRVRLRMVPQNQQDITIFGISGEQYEREFGIELLGDAQPPFNNRPGSRIRLNNTFDLNYDRWVLTVMHEIGHSLGLGHTNTNFEFNELTGTSTEIPGTTVDDDSFMFNRVRSGRTGVFSSGDVRALQTMYGFDSNQSICF